MAELNKRQRQFVEEYLIDLSGTHAAIRAGYSAKTASRISQELFSKPHVAEAVRKGMEERAKRNKISQDRVLQEYAKIAFFDPRRLYDDQGNLVPIQNLPEDVAAAIAGVDVVVGKKSDVAVAEAAAEAAGGASSTTAITTTVRKIKLVDKKGALDSLARHLGMFLDKSEVTIKGDLAERLARAKERVSESGD